MCEERVIATGKITARKILPELRDLSLNSLRLSPDGSSLSYIHTFNEQARPERRNFTFYDTRTWTEKTFPQSRYVRVGIPFGWDRENLTRSGSTGEKVLDEQSAGKVYFQYEQYKVIVRETIKDSDNLGEIDITNMTSRDLYRETTGEGGREFPRFPSMGFSPDGKRVALLTTNTMWIIEIEGDREPLLLTWRSKAQLETPGVETWGYESWLTWVDKNTVAVAVNSRRVAQYKSEEPKFFFQTVPSKEEAK